MIASDPHVGLFLPNFWILMGIKSPQYHAFGMMIPGAPVIGVGRNKDIAWGGTNMRGISSHLYDVSELPKKDITIRKEEVKRRWWATSEFNIRETPYGPILTDVELFDPKTRQKPLALDWRGRKGSDEIQSLLDAMRASNWQEFKKSFENYKVSAMNLTYADKQGNIGMVAAYAQPVLKDPSRTLDFIKKTDNPIVGEIRPVDHPNPFNPEEGFIASANNKPFSQPRHPIAFNFATSDRVNRLKQLARKNKKVSLLDLKALQLDVYNQNAMDITQLLIPYLPQKTSKQAMTLAGWNGEFRANSEGAVSFFALSRMLWTSHIDETDEKGFEKEEILEASDWKDQLLKLLKRKTQRVDSSQSH
jgi:penicillin amidase